MRRLSFATLVFAVASMSFLGCRQAAGPTAGGSMSSGSMSSAMQSPSFNPFGGSTRVSPPPPNASAAPNPYIGGPPGQTNAVQGTAGGFVSAAPGVSGQIVGSGVQPAGFVGSGTNPIAPIAQAEFTATNDTPVFAGGSVAAANYGTSAPATVNPFRAGGMQVNDLTRAPTPPGYRAPPGYQPPVQNNQAPVHPAFSPASAPITPANGGAAVGGVPASPATPIQQIPYQQPQVWQGTPVTSISDTEVASRMVPVNSIPSNSNAPVAQPAASQTQNSGAAGSSDLMWRRPGS